MKLCNSLVRILFFLAANARSVIADEQVGPDGAPGGPGGPGGPNDDDMEISVLEDLLSEPDTLWTAQILPDADLGSVNIEAGNGVFMAPDGKHIIVTTVGATVYAYNAYNGVKKWHYQPEAVGSSIARSHSAITFAPSGDFMVYSVVDNENSLNPSSRVIALDMEGNALWVSEDLDGVAAGSPQVSSDGLFVFLTHNTDEKTDGFFTILDVNATGSIFYSGSSGENGDSPTNAYGPVGIFHSPEQGNFDPIDAGAPVSEGDFNTNDMLLWAQTPKPTDTTIENGFLYGFQFPRDFIGNASDISYFQMGNFERDFQSLTAPVMTNDGLSAYWGVSRGGFRGWTPKRFSRARSATIGFKRNEDFPGQPVWAVPALSNDGPTPTIFGGSSAREFVRMNFDFSEQVVVDTSSYVKNKALVDGDDRAVYYVEGDSGTLHQADFDTLTDLWNFPVNFSVDGEMAITPNSDVVIIADTRGVITALKVAEIAITDAPSLMPSDGPSMMPSSKASATKAPVVTTESPTFTATTAAPVPEATTDAPVVTPGTNEPTAAPVAEPTAEAVVEPTDAPVAAPVSAPVPAAVPAVDSNSGAVGIISRSITFIVATLVAGMMMI